VTSCTHAFALRAPVAAAALLLALCASGADDPGAAVAKPQVKVGDRWTSRTTNLLRPNAPAVTVDSRVVSTGPDEIVLVSKRRDREGEVDSFWTSEWNAVALPTMTFTPHLGHFKFPLKVGASYVAAWEGIAKGSGWRGKFEIQFKVTGWEDVTVPAGKFRALKLEGDGTYTRLDQAGGGWTRYAYWYVPEVKRFAKYTWVSEGMNVNQVIELVEFSVQ
jgi:hypothetical protein